LVRASGITSAELLSLSAAARAVVQGFVEDAGPEGSQTSCALVGTVWSILVRLARLRRADLLVTEGFAAKVGLHDGQSTSGKAAWTVQLSGVLRILPSLARTSVVGSDSSTEVEEAALLADLLTREVRWQCLFAQALAVLEICPTSLVLHNLIHRLARNFWEGPTAKPGPEDRDQRRDDPERVTALALADHGDCAQELDAEAEERAVVALGAVLWAVQEDGSPDDDHRAGLMLLLHTVASLPYRACVAWRVQVLVCCVLLVLNPGTVFDTELLAGLPGPNAILAESAQMGGDVLSEAERAQQLTAAKLFGQVLAACDRGQSH